MVFVGNSHMRDLMVETMVLESAFESWAGSSPQGHQQQMSAARRRNFMYKYGWNWRNVSMDIRQSTSTASSTMQQRVLISALHFDKVASFLDLMLAGEAEFNSEGESKRTVRWTNSSTLIFTAGFFAAEFTDILAVMHTGMSAISDALDRTLAAHPDLKVVFLTLPPMGSQSPMHLQRINDIMVGLLRERHGEAVAVVDHLRLAISDFDNQWHDTHHVGASCAVCDRKSRPLMRGVLNSLVATLCG